MSKGETYEQLKTWVFYKFELPISNFIQGVRNLITWSRVVWEDFDYDFTSIYDILAFKLEKQVKHLSRNKYLDSSDTTISRLRLCINLIDRVRNEYYINELSEYQNINYDFIKIPDTDLYELKSDIVSERYTEYIQKYKSVYNKLISGKLNSNRIEFNNVQSICMYIARYNQQRAKKLLFNVLEKDIETWWD
jgi:hypothetical protein